MQIPRFLVGQTPWFEDDYGSTSGVIFAATDEIRQHRPPATPSQNPVNVFWHTHDTVTAVVHSHWAVIFVNTLYNMDNLYTVVLTAHRALENFKTHVP